MAEPLSKETFETYTGEHQKYLDSKFEKLAGCIAGVKKSVDEIKDARKEDWKQHAEQCEICKACHEKKFKKLHKYIIAGCICAALFGAILAPSLGWTHVIGFITKMLTGTAPIGM
ncbi:MAG: hypothetical protein PVI03_06340 [Candidatus Thorarchaeota archaeon]|jgi:hypothetical protein